MGVSGLISSPVSVCLYRRDVSMATVTGRSFLNASASSSAALESACTDPWKSCSKPTDSASKVTRPVLKGPLSVALVFTL
jgi:hypothetical protein